MDIDVIDASQCFSVTVLTSHMMHYAVESNNGGSFTT